MGLADAGRSHKSENHPEVMLSTSEASAFTAFLAQERDTQRFSSAGGCRLMNHFVWKLSPPFGCDVARVRLPIRCCFRLRHSKIDRWLAAWDWQAVASVG